jgi:hypothetical protein
MFIGFNPVAGNALRQSAGAVGDGKICSSFTIAHRGEMDHPIGGNGLSGGFIIGGLFSINCYY